MGHTQMDRILIIKHPNTSMAEVQTTDRLCEYRWRLSPPADEELSAEFIAFRDKLEDIHGIEKVSIGRHDISIDRYDVFSFDELIPQVIDVLKGYTGKTEYEITVDDRAAEYEAREAARRAARAAKGLPEYDERDDDY